jgi:1,4-alpha-glucan branching enzyme
LPLVRLDEAQALRDPASLDNAMWEASTWGSGGDLSTWSNAKVADIAFATRAGELQTLTAGREASPVALRELLALQASDWAFMVSRDLATPYARERFAAHDEALRGALAHSSEAGAAQLRNLAPWADPAVLLGC